MDGPVPRDVSAVVDRHLLGCRECAAFREAAQRVRSTVRVRPAEEVPDLVDPIMATIAAGDVSPAGRTASLRRRVRPRIAMRWVAAAAVGALVGSLLVGGPWPDADRGAALATVVQRVHDVAPSIEAFDASYVITERGLHPSVPERSLRMRIAFLAPQRFRLEVTDDTTYPTPDWTPTDIRYVEDTPSTYLVGPTGCPADLGGDVCPPTRVAVTRASAWSPAAPLPQDLIVPVATLGAGPGIRLVGEEDLDGRRSVHLRMSFERAAPLFPFLRLGGTWRPYFAGDVVDVWLDATGWFPVAITVTPSSRPGRGAWELRYGRPPEGTETPVLEVRLTGVAETSPAPGAFRIPGLTKWTAGGDDEPADVLGFDPTLPADAGGLELVSATGPPPGASGPRSVVVYGRGLDYIRIVEDRAWRGPGVYGPFGDLAAWIDVPGLGPVLYEPATAELGRRIAVHASSSDLYLESNLPRDELLAVTASLPVTADLRDDWLVTTTPEARIEQVRPGAGLALASFARPSSDALPGGYVVTGARVEYDDDAVSTVTLVLRQPMSDLAGPPLFLRSTQLDIGHATGGTAVDLGAVAGSLSGAGTRLEWRDDGWVRVLQGAPGSSTLTQIAMAFTGAR